MAKTIFNRVADRILSIVGLDFDFSFEMRGDAFNQITRDIFVGVRPQPEGIQTLKEAGITHVISCLPEAERPKMSFLQQDFHPFFLAIHDGIHEDLTPTFPKVFEYVSQERKSHSKAKFLIHCEVGVSRSATLAIALLMKSEGKDFFETYRQVRLKRPGVLPNIGFASQLQRLEHTWRPNERPHGKFSSLTHYLHQICNVPVEIEILQEMLERHD